MREVKRNGKVNAVVLQGLVRTSQKRVCHVECSIEMKRLRGELSVVTKCTQCLKEGPLMWRHFLQGTLKIHYVSQVKYMNLTPLDC